MTVHHLDCAGMCPVGGRLLLGSGGLLTGRLVSHCLLLETDDGLVLVDTGLGTGDLADPRRLGRTFRTTLRPQLAPAQTALHQIRARGFAPEDVRHILLTHLDLDHAGGLSDFPHARVHVLADELRAATSPTTRGERSRYRPAQWAHQPHWVTYDSAPETWKGFRAVRPLPRTTPEILLIPLPGHTRGHSGVAVRHSTGWLLHCGDAYFTPADIAPGTARRPLGLTAFQRYVAADDAGRRHNQRRLRDLQHRHSGSVRLLCAHDAQTFEALRGAEPTRMA